MGDFKDAIGSLGAKLTQSVSDGVDAIKGPASAPPPPPSDDLGPDDASTADSPAKIMKALEMAARINFKLQRSLAAVAIKFITKHPPPISIDLRFDPEIISSILLQCQKSHCYSGRQLAWLDSIDPATPPRVPVPVDDQLLAQINVINGHVLSNDQGKAEELALQLQQEHPDLRHPVVSNLCFESAMRSVDQETQHQAALRQLESNSFDRNAAIVAAQSAEPKSLREQACDMVLR